VENNALSLAVKRRREELGLTQEELSLLAGVGDVFIYHLEHGKKTLRTDKVLAVLHALGLQIRIENGNEGVVDGTRPS